MRVGWHCREGSSEDDGYLLTQVYDADADASALLVNAKPFTLNPKP
jgi:carotenoid cleavage dioxygenase-like enzyme